MFNWFNTNIYSITGIISIKPIKEWQNVININTNCYEKWKFIILDFRTPKEI